MSRSPRGLRLSHARTEGGVRTVARSAGAEDPPAAGGGDWPSGPAPGRGGGLHAHGRAWAPGDGRD